MSEVVTQTSLDFQIRCANMKDAVEILDLQCQHLITTQNGEYLEKDGKLENSFSLSQIKELCSRGCVKLATVKEKELEKIVGYIITQYFKVLNDEKTVSFFKKNIEGNPALLSQICVIKNYRRHGVGKALLKQAIDKGRRVGNKKFVAFVIDLNFAVKGFLQNSNFKSRLISEHHLNPNKKLASYFIEYQ